MGGEFGGKAHNSSYCAHGSVSGPMVIGESTLILLLLLSLYTTSDKT